MLEFIVLGQIPGTEVYISFTMITIGILAAASGILLGYGIIKLSQFKFKFKQKIIQQQTV